MANQQRRSPRDILSIGRRLGDRGVRLVSADRRMLPNFLVIGAMKAGTTSLYRYLAGHPDVVPATRKEIHFFNRHYDKGHRWYRSHFPLAAKPARTNRLTGEATTHYLFHPDAPARAHALVPDARLIVLLRDPVDRAFSHYRHEASRHGETRGFEVAIAEEQARLEHGADDGEPALDKRAYLARGLYAAQLERWFSVYPRPQLLALWSDDLFADPARVYAEVTNFLGLPPVQPETFRVHYPSPPGQLDEGTREQLTAFFREPNRRLAALLGRDLPW